MSYDSDLNNVNALEISHYHNDNYNVISSELFEEVTRLENLNESLNSTYGFELDSKRDTLAIVLPVTIIYSLIFVTGVIGNISTCIVIKKNRSMHTATNYYLFSLAVSDFLLLLSGVPQEMYFIWSKYPYVFGEYFCVGRGMMAETSANATVLTITAFTVERYLAICHPFFGQAMSKLSRAMRIIVLIWTLSILTAIPQAAQFGITINDGIEKCSVVRNIIRHSFQLSTFIFFFAPMSIILVLYLLIGLRLCRSNSSLDPNKMGIKGSRSAIEDGSSIRFFNSTGRLRTTQSDNVLCRYSGGTQQNAVRGRMNQSGTRVIKMLVAVVICFFLCWAPFHAQRLIAVYGIRGYTDTDKHHHRIIYTVATYVSGVLYYLSTCINPLLYNMMSNKFREAFKAILIRRKSKGSINSRLTQESRYMRRNPTFNTSLREPSDLLQAISNERQI